MEAGSEAMEACIKTARQYWVEKGELNRKYIIARFPSYHGNTLGALAVSCIYRIASVFLEINNHVAHADLLRSVTSQAAATSTFPCSPLTPFNTSPPRPIAVPTSPTKHKKFTPPVSPPSSK